MLQHTCNLQALIMRATNLLELLCNPVWLHDLQAARNEIEKLKLSEMTAREAVMEAAKLLHKVKGQDFA